MGNFQRWAPDRDVNMELVLTEWDDEIEGEWVRAEDAINREAELLARIHELETQAARAAELIEKAVGMMRPEGG